MIATLFALFASGVQIAPFQDTVRFQQGVEYRIEATLDEPTDVLHGRARLRYTNRSAATFDTLYFHQHLNAFRPNSGWARRELEGGERRFTDLDPDEHAFERFRTITVDGEPVQPVYPGAPDSTVAAVPLPTPLAPGETITVLLDWDARLSTTPRRQGREGRHYDWAQWYPRIAVFDRGGWQFNPLMPQGEFYGEFGSYDITLDVAEDQVIGSTGVPVEGDPGWQRAAADPQAAIDFQRDAYTPEPAEDLGLLAGDAEPGRKRVRWRAEDVHHFAWSANPEYIYEGGDVPRVGDAADAAPIAIHVLYQPGDTAWDEGVVVERTENALRWLQGMFGPYPWPQLTNVHRIEGGGTEFPMLVMDGSESEGLIVHEATHQYLHGILGNNEWREGWLDEGFTSFMTNWYFEEQGAEDVWTRSVERAAELERAGQTQPISTPGHEFADFATYGAMTYTKPSVVFRMLRETVGEDTMREILRSYFERYKLGHVDEQDFREVVNEVTGEDYDWFFDQWLHTTDKLDYGIASARTERLPGGEWQTRVEVVRTGDAWMPVTLRVGNETRTLDSRERSQTVEVVTPERPEEAVLDPAEVLLDTDPSNDRRSLRG